MATYKLLQDIEADDHILGPLTLRQFIFGMIAIFLSYMCFFVIQKQVAFLLVVFLPPALFFGFFALPFGRDQPTEIWALAKLRYYFKPRNRIWSQDGIKELVTITAPKKVEPVFTNGLTQTEVKSRLRALADTLDSRGWAVKNVTADVYTSPLTKKSHSDRLLELTDMPQPVPDADVPVAADILDESNNPVAQQFGDMIDQSAQAHRQQLVAQLNDAAAKQSPAAQQNDYWFMNGNAGAPSAVPPPEAASVGSTEEKALSAELKSRTGGRVSPYSNLRTVKPVSPPPAQAVQTSSAPVTDTPDPAILSLADNDDLNVSTLAREAKRVSGEDKPESDEVVISLH